MWEFRGKKELDYFVESNGIPQDEFCIVGGLALNCLALREHGDLDIVLSSRQMKRMKEKYGSVTYHVELIPFTVNQEEGDIKINRYIPVGYSDDDIVYNSNYYFWFNGYKIIRPEISLAIRLYDISVRCDDYKAKRDVKLLTEYARKNPEEWEWELVTDSKIQEVKEEKTSLFQFIWKFRPSNIKRFIKRALKRKEFIDTVYENVSQNTFLSCSVGELLNNQRNGEDFDAYDIILRYKVVEELSEKNCSIWEILYKKMQDQRGFGDIQNIERFKFLIKSIEKCGLNKKFTILIDENGVIVDGAHRLACHIFHGEQYCSISLVQQQFQYRNYGIKWFVENGFSNEEVNMLEFEKNDLFYNLGLYWPIFLWSPLLSIETDIYSLIKEHNMVYKFSKIINMDDEKQFEKFMFQIYSSDDIEKWKIARKMAFIKKYGLQIKVIWVEVPKPLFRQKISNRNDISTVVESFKKDLREKYKNNFENYIYDILCHMGDNFQQNIIMNEILKKYVNIDFNYLNDR